MLPRDVSKILGEPAPVETGSASAGANLPSAGAPSAGPNSPPARVDWESHLEMLPIATWICSSDGSGMFCNLACRRLLGVVRVEELLPDKWVKHIHPDDREDYVRRWNLFIDTPTAAFKARVRWKRPDTGQTVHLTVRAQRLDSGKFQGWIREAGAEQALTKLREIANDSL